MRFQKIVFLITIILLVGMGLFSLNKSNQNNEKYSRLEFDQYDNSLADIVLVSKENFVVASLKDVAKYPTIYVGKNYLAKMSWKQLKKEYLQNAKDIDRKIRNEEYLRIDIYDLNSQKKVGTYDLSRNIREHLRDKDIEIDMINLRGIGIKNSNEFLEIDVYKEPGVILSAFSLNLETEQLYDQKQSEKMGLNSRQLSDGSYLSKLKIYLNEFYGLTLTADNYEVGSPYYQNGGGDKINNLHQGAILETNFATEYPELAKKLDQHQLVIAPRLGMASDEVIFNQINYWFAKKGEDSLPLVYYRKSTKEQIPIRSYEDYIRESKIE